MAIGPQRQLYNKVLNLAATRAGEAGGIVSRVMSSGLEVVGYVEDITDVWPIGIQLHNVEHIDEGYQYNPWMQRGVRRVSKIGEIVGISTHCIVDTNFIHPNANPNSAKKAYLATSGLITDDASLGGAHIGFFLSNLNDTIPGLPRGSGYLTIYGGGFARGEHIDNQLPAGQRIVNDVVEEIRIVSPGWARVRITL